jgi:hypothetical protein
MTVYSPEEIKKAAAKIANCLALSNSSNPHEAESAKRQAELLMKKYGLTEADVEHSKISQEDYVSKHKRLPVWCAALSAVVSKAFSCQCTHGYLKVTFYGYAAKPLYASYTYDVLSRHILKMRKEYLASLGVES